LRQQCRQGANPLRYREGKVKREHHSLPEAEPLLAALDGHPAVQSILPGPILRKHSAGLAGIRLAPSAQGDMAFAVHSRLYVQSVHAVVAPADRLRVLADLRRSGLLRDHDAQPPPLPPPAPQSVHRAAPPARHPTARSSARSATRPVPAPPLPRMAVTAVDSLAPSLDPEVLHRVRAVLPALGYARGRCVYLPLEGEMVAVEGSRVVAAFPHQPPWVSPEALDALAGAGLSADDVAALVLAAGLWDATGLYRAREWELTMDRGDLTGARRLADPGQRG
jgi:hypothetical protein